MARYTLRVNGREHEVDAEPGDSLLSILRTDLGLTGSHYGCGEGQCGACTVLLDGLAARSCVTRVGSVGTKAITTIEGLAREAERGAGAPASDEPGSGAEPQVMMPRLHAVQQAFLEVEAFQCGYCTSGMIVATVGLLKTNPNPSDADIARLMDRNVCRCGTYPRIVRAVKLAAERTRATAPAQVGGVR
jgi:aerobic-type carbon monoxide dehydrogenase small subunit (CoxS/CutS family)